MPRGNNNTGDNDGLVVELFRYGGKGVVICSLLKVLYAVVWTEKSVPKQQGQVLLLACIRKVILRTWAFTEALHY